MEKTIGEDDVLDEINSLGRRPRERKWKGMSEEIDD